MQLPFAVLIALQFGVWHSLVAESTSHRKHWTLLVVLASQELSQALVLDREVVEHSVLTVVVAQVALAAQTCPVPIPPQAALVACLESSSSYPWTLIWELLALQGPGCDQRDVHFAYKFCRRLGPAPTLSRDRGAQLGM